MIQSHHLQGAHYPCLLKLRFVKIVSYGSSVYDQIGGDVTAYIGSVLVDVCVLHCSEVVYSRTVRHMDNELPEDGVTALEHVGAISL